MKVSVCMPVYNGEKYLRPAIESILNQTLSDFEFIIFDDCSTDASAAIIEEYARKDTRIRFERNEKNLGLFGNWNKTMLAAQGEYIKPFAQDDFCKPALLARLAQALDEHKTVSLAGCAREYFKGEKAYAVEPDARRYYRDKIFPGKDVSLMFLVDGYNLVGFPPAIMFRKEHLDGGFDQRYFHCGDVEFFIRLLMKGDYYFVFKPLVTYREHGQNQTFKNFAELKYMSDILLLKKDFAEFARVNGVDNFDEVVADQLANVVGVGTGYLNIDYSQLKSAGILANTEVATEIVLRLAERVVQLKQQASTADASPAHREEAERIAAEREKLMQDNHHLHHQIHSLVNSTSWKLTKPIRAVKRLVARR